MYAKTQYSQDCLVTVCVYLRTLHMQRLVSKRLAGSGILVIGRGSKHYRQRTSPSSPPRRLLMALWCTKSTLNSNGQATSASMQQTRSGLLTVIIMCVEILLLPFPTHSVNKACQVLMAMLKFYFIFCTGYLTQTLMFVIPLYRGEYTTTEASSAEMLSVETLLPLFVLAVIVTPYCVRREHKIGTGLLMVSMPRLRRAALILQGYASAFPDLYVLQLHTHVHKF